MLHIKIKRPAIAMIELIFAIVIMGIVMMSAPMLISTAAKSGYVTIQQEAINEAASQVNIVMGYHWDEATADEMYLDPILNVSNGTADLNVSGTTARRKGTPQESERAFIRSDGTDDLNASSTLGSETGETEEDDIDDFAGDTLLTLKGTNTAGNIETTTIRIATVISYNEDNVSGDYNQSSITYDPFSTSASGKTSNIKEIAVTLTSSSTSEELNSKEIVLRAFSCNIGGYKLEEKDF